MRNHRRQRKGAHPWLAIVVLAGLALAAGAGDIVARNGGPRDMGAAQETGLPPMASDSAGMASDGVGHAGGKDGRSPWAGGRGIGRPGGRAREPLARAALAKETAVHVNEFQMDKIYLSKIYSMLCQIEYLYKYSISNIYNNKTMNGMCYMEAKDGPAHGAGVQTAGRPGGLARETMAKGEGADGDGGQVAVPQGAWAGETVAGDAAVQGGGPGHGGDRHGGSEDGGAPPCGVRNPPAPGPGDAAPGSQAQGPVTGAEGTGAYMVRLGPQEFTPAGLARIEATVVPLGPGGVPPGPGVLFSWHEGQASLGSGQAGQGQYVSREAEAGEPRVTVEAGGYSRVELTARLDIGGVVHYAQADFNLFAREGSRSRPSAAGAPGWPFFELGSEAPLYWPQTGQTFHVRILGLDLPPGPMAVWEEGGGAPAAVIVPDEGGLYSYAPPHDPALDRLGATASKNLVFVHPLGGGGTASLSFAVHRSRVERRRLGAGLAVFLAGLAGGGWFLAARRRRVVPCA